MRKCLECGTILSIVVTLIAVGANTFQLFVCECVSVLSIERDFSGATEPSRFVCMFNLNIHTHNTIQKVYQKK